MKKLFILNTGRTLKQGISLEADGKYSDKYNDEVATVRINPDDARELGIKDKCRITSKYSSIILKVVLDPNIPRGMIYIPMGPYANILVDPDTEGVGMPNLKHTYVHIEATDKRETTLRDVLETYNIRRIEYYPLERPTKSGVKRIIENYICPLCGELCDYLRVELDGDRIVNVIGACPKGKAKLLNYHRDRILKPMIKVNGRLKEVSLEEALDKATEILVNSKHPLLFGWSSSSNEAMDVGMELAELLSGLIDNTTVICHGPTTLAVQETGSARATLGVIRNLADVIVLWGSNPVEAHPNHLPRWIFSKGTDISGRRERKVIVVDVRYTPTAKIADKFLKVLPGRDYELITAMRMILKDLEVESEEVAGIPISEVYEVVDIMRSAKYGVIFVGMGVTMTGAKYRNLEELIKLVHDLNEWTRFALIPMRGHYNVSGVNEVMLWNSGYPYAIDFYRGYPKYIPGVTTATDALINGDVDAALIIASDPVAHLPRKAVEHLSKIPVILIDPKWNLTALIADVIIPSAMTGIEADGTAYRLDNVPLRLKKIVDPPEGILSDKEILEMILNRVKRIKLGG